MTKHFSKWVSKQKISGEELANALTELQTGNFEANLGGCIYKKRIMRKSIADSITGTVRDLNRSGLVNDSTMKNIENLCLPEIREYSPEKIISIRKKFRLSQAALASIFNISPSTVQKWEQGNIKPAGASKKLLDIIERKGLEALI